nr:RecName: Full=Isocitrate lyase; Short=ICL; AltName: Full=Isocitrase; AltName: Full=Isocitratase [Acinetobacter calcoaceticus]AAB20173.1 isocitrate lyase [Acinetobacter calcoaceticus, Peptide Partial, 15 aa] [Acinetobacter calcoaceticus]
MTYQTAIDAVRELKA